jgi:CRP/FNR family transcriptional regulator, cyclic AMP receptor protein
MYINEGLKKQRLFLLINNDLLLCGSISHQLQEYDLIDKEPIAMIDADFLIDNHEIIQSISKIPILKSFEENELRDLLGISEVRDYCAGDLILEENDYGGWIFYLISGKVKIVKQTKVLAILNRCGDVFGAIGYLEKKARSASVFAVEDTSCLAISGADVNHMPLNSKYALRFIIYKEFAEMLANRLRVTTEELTRHKQKTDKMALQYQVATKDLELMKAQMKISELEAKLSG